MFISEVINISNKDNYLSQHKEINANIGLRMKTSKYLI